MNFSLARLGKVDVRKDEEQNVKLTQILKLLFEAGYFRARIKGIHPFDKIIGGMTWCIELCAFDIDVDLLFHDGLAIGQKIALTERIVRVLKYMKCPHQLEPHQIQGQDFIHIHPIIVWLVKLAANTRTEYEDETRAISVAEFKLQYSDYLKMTSREEHFRQTEVIRQIKVKFSDKSVNGKSEVCSKTDQQPTTDYAAPRDAEEIEINDDSVTGKAERLATSSDKALSKEVNKVMTKLDIAKTTLHDLKSRENKLATISAEIASNYNQLLDEKQTIEFAKSCDERELVEVVQLYQENKAIRSRMATFKENCYTKLEQMQEQIQSLKDKIELPSEKVDASLMHSHASEQERLTILRTDLADRSNEFERMKLQIDSTPGRAELAQYQKRLVELYSQVDAVHQETHQFYNLYNTLTDAKVYMEREFQLMDSINVNVENVSGEALKKSQFCQQLTTARDNIEENRNKLEEKLKAAQLNRQQIANELNRLQELKVRYGSMLRAVDKAVLENEQLQRPFNEF